MGILKSISKSMKGTFIGDMAKSADKAVDATGSFISDCIDETICGIADGADSISKGFGKITKGAGKMARVASGYEAYDSRKKAKEAKELADRMAANIEEKTEEEEKNPTLCCRILVRRNWNFLRLVFLHFWATLRLWGIIIRIKNMNLVAR